MPGNTVKVTLLADAKGFQKGMKDAEGATDTFQGKASAFSGAVKGIFAGAAAGAVVNFAQQSIAAFSDAEQAIGSVESVFGESADSIVAMSEDAAERFGLSAAEFNKQAALIGSQLKNQLGLSAEEAADQTDDLIGKASDLAATFGGTTADAVSAISGLLRGERDQIEKYGVSMNDAAVSAHALEMGLADSTKELTAQDKAASSLDLLYEQSADSAGQFARESDTLAGSMQILTARVEDLKARVGQELAPVMVEGTTAANNMLDALDEDVNLGWSQRLSAAVQTLLGESAESVTAYIEQKEAANNAADGYDDAALSMENARQVMGEYNARAVAAQTETNNLAGAQDNLASSTDDARIAQQELRDEIRAQTDPVFAYAEAQRDLAEAQAAVTEAAEKFGEGTPEHLAALDDLRTAGYDVQDAEMAMAEGMGTSRSQMETHLRSLRIYTEEQIQMILDDMDRINAFTFRAKTIQITHKVTGGGLQERQHGGPVLPGQPYLVGERGPELFTPSTSGRVHAAGTGRPGGAAGAVYNITINAGMGSDPNAISRGVVQALQRYERANGTIPITTRPAS